MEMASPSSDSSKQTDPEHFRLSSLDGESRPLKLFEQKDEELAQSEDGLLPIPEEAKPKRRGNVMMLVWILVNTFATIGIVRITRLAGEKQQQANTLSTVKVFVNKALFDDPQFKHVQLSFVTYHFALTTLLLYELSRPRWAFFEVKRAKITEMLPLAISFCLQVVLPNCSLAYSSVVFYQMVRVLLTPFVALINYFNYAQSIPKAATYTLIPVCVGVGILSYYEAVPQADTEGKRTSFLGVFFAFTGVLASSMYTVWIKVYHKRLEMNSMQLLFNQAPIGAVILLYIVPFADTFPAWSEITLGKWTMVFMVRIHVRCWQMH